MSTALVEDVHGVHGADDDDADGGATGVIYACDLCQLQLRHGSWWPNLDATRICACVASRRLAVVGNVDRVWFSGGGVCADAAVAAAGKDYRLYLPDALDPRNYAGNCSCPCCCEK